MIELLSPAGDFECVKAAVQNGANAIYFGSSSFSARAYANNFNFDEMKQTIIYCKTRNVKTFLAINTLIKNEEFDTAIDIIQNAYTFGIDAIIVQDLGLAKIIHNLLPDLPLHASTQMSVHNLNGVLELENLGFKRVVLSRELSINEIKYICDNSNVEIECFIHGALCISYSGQCLFSSMVGGRSGNRGKCAQPCRLPYSLMEQENTNNSDNKNKNLDFGYLMSPKDLCSIDLIPNFINSGANSLKIEGRMKSPEYVGTVTRIYRKYIDLAYSNNDYIVSDNDKKDLLQVFNRGNFSTGHLQKQENTNLIFKEKPNNMGIFLGTVIKYIENKSYITLKLNEQINIGDTISIQNESGTYTISEIMDKNINIKTNTIGQIITLGRVKGNIKSGDKVYKISSKKLLEQAKDSFNFENIKIGLSCNISIKKDLPISIEIFPNTNIEIYKDLYIKHTINSIPVEAIKRPIDKESIIKQISKTTDTPFVFNNINIDLDDNLFIPKLSILNELRRTAIDLVYEYIEKNSKRTLDSKNDTKNIDTNKNILSENIDKSNIKDIHSKKISLLLNNLNLNFDYSNLHDIDKLYLPAKYFNDDKYIDILTLLTNKFNTYIYMPTILKDNFNNLFKSIISKAINAYLIKGFVVSNLGSINLVKDVLNMNNIEDNNISEKNKKYKENKKYELISNYTFNIINPYSISRLSDLNIDTYTISPELDFDNINNLYIFNNNINSELIVYGKIPIMNTNYCFLGKSNKCYSNCDKYCIKKDITKERNIHNYYLSDKLNMNFDICIDNIQTITTIYNSKILSISSDKFNCDFARIDILNENIEEINNIILSVKIGNRLEGNNYTNGNLYRSI